ncbi:MAG TPA: hypothetical protein VFE37_30650 [Chloroflexota bacterium]|nr:hypothetical protein [Chloroflexota bacterium]
MTRPHLARRLAGTLGALFLGLAALAPTAAPAHARLTAPAPPPTDQTISSSCPTQGGYLAGSGFYLDFPYVQGTVSGYGFGHGYPFYGTPYPVWGGGFGYASYTYYPAVGTPTAGVAPGFLNPINAYNAVPGPLGPSYPAGFPYYAGYPFPPSYPTFSYPQSGGQPIGSFTGFWDPFYVGRGAGRAGQYGEGC